VTGDGPRGTRPKSPRRDAMEASAPVPRRPATPGREALDGAWDIEMTRLLREAAEIREERDRARLSEDTLLARSETDALLGAIRTRGRPRVKHYILRPSAGRAAGRSQATP
jgi:hypothetical protein